MSWWSFDFTEQEQCGREDKRQKPDWTSVPAVGLKEKRPKEETESAQLK